jgi:hypothetical protein
MHKQAAKKEKVAETAAFFAREEFRGFLAIPGTRTGCWGFLPFCVREGPTD